MFVLRIRFLSFELLKAEQKMKLLSFPSLLIILLIISNHFILAQTAAVKFEVNIPEKSVNNNSTVFLAGSFNCWNPRDSLYEMKKTGDNTFSLVVPLFDGQKYEYKYTLGSWETVETSLQGEEIQNRKMVSGDGLVVRDTVLNWNSPGSQQKEITGKLNKEQMDMFSKLKDSLSTSLENRMKKVADILKKAGENMLSENPDMELRQKYHNEIVASIDSTIGVATDMLWKVTSMLTPEQRKEILTEMKNSGNPGVLFDWIDKATEKPEE
jgi:hypothetical protein